jgi:hypothetical protein
MKERLDYFFIGTEQVLNRSIGTRWARHVARMRARRIVHRVLVGKHEGKKPLGRPRHRWEDNIKMDLHVWVGGVLYWSDMVGIGRGGGHL